MIILNILNEILISYDENINNNKIIVTYLRHLL